MADETEISDRQQSVAVGCLMAIVGLFSGAMVAVLIAKWVGAARGCTPAAGLPACDWHIFAGVGAVIGVLTLPTLTLLALRRSRRRSGTTERG